MRNHTFSVSRNRELTPLEARLGYIRRRITDPLRRNSVGKPANVAIAHEQSPEMPKGKRRQKRLSWDGEVSDVEGNYINGTGSNNNVGAFGERERNSGNSHHAADQVDGARRGQISAPRDSHQPRLGPWTQAVDEVVQNMGSTHRAIKDLEERFRSHMDELMDTDETKNMLNRLKGECSEKDEQIEMLKSTIAVLRNMDTAAKADIDRTWAEIKKSRERLNEEETKQEKRFAAMIAQDRLKLTNEFEKLTKEYYRSYAERRKELEDEGIRMKAEQKQLTATVDAQRKTCEAQSEELKTALDQCDHWKRIAESYKQEKQHLERELQVVKDGLALESKPQEFFKQAFASIYSSVERLSLNYFHDIGGKELESIHEVLARADPYFSSVPIDDTIDSHDLRAAHAQRIITNAICTYIWKPLSSEFTLLHPEVNSMLGKLSDQLRNSTGGGRSANVWTALTMRALESLPIQQETTHITESQGISQVGSSARANRVISEVISVLSPLVDVSQVKALQEDIDKVANAAIDVWDIAQRSGELNITATQLLEHANREQWRAPQFDPVAPSRGQDEADFDAMSRTRPRIMTLFPRVVGWTVVDLVDEKSPPGSFPRESGQAPHFTETCIHPGRGLPEWSSLVVRGKEQREEQMDFLSKAMENARKAAYKRAPERRRTSISRA